MTLHTPVPRFRPLATMLGMFALLPATVMAQGGTAPSPAPASADAPEGFIQQRSVTVHPGEFRAAPLVYGPAGPTGMGRVAGAPGNSDAFSFSGGDQLQLGDRLYLVPPDGPLAVGGVLIVADSGGVLPGGGRVMLPTGMVRVERIAAGEAVTARVIEQYGPMRIGQPVMQYQQPTAMPTGFVAVSDPVAATVAWRPLSPVLPGTMQWMVLEASAGANLVPGDQLTLVRPRVQTRDGVTLPEEPLGTAIVVRSGDYGVTALLIRIQSGVITEGTVARRTGAAR